MPTMDSWSYQSTASGPYDLNPHLNLMNSTSNPYQNFNTSQNSFGYMLNNHETQMYNPPNSLRSTMPEFNHNMASLNSTPSSHHSLSPLREYGMIPNVHGHHTVPVQPQVQAASQSQSHSQHHSPSDIIIEDDSSLNNKLDYVSHLSPEKYVNLQQTNSPDKFDQNELLVHEFNKNLTESISFDNRLKNDDKIHENSNYVPLPSFLN